MAHCTITLGSLQNEGQLTKGDILTHSERGDCKFLRVAPNNTLEVQHIATGQLYQWDIDFKGTAIYFDKGE